MIKIHVYQREVALWRGLSVFSDFIYNTMEKNRVALTKVKFHHFPGSVLTHCVYFAICERPPDI